MVEISKMVKIFYLYKTQHEVMHISMYNFVFDSLSFVKVCLALTRPEAVTLQSLIVTKLRKVFS